MTIFSRQKKGTRILLYFLAVLFLLIGALGVAVYFYSEKIASRVLQSTRVRDGIVDTVTRGSHFAGDELLGELFPWFLGFDKPRTYLVLFQNNTELRPSGGFIGVYAVVRVDKGKTELLKLEGSEVLDWNTPDDWNPVAPKPISDRLGVQRWYFRDSNWSADFPTAAQNALRLYEGEGGAYAKDIDAVVAATPTVLERLLVLTGPVTVEGIEFAPENAVARLEYEVEYDYKKRGIPVEQRKAIIDPLVRSIIQKAGIDLFLHPEKYLKSLRTLFEEKHILVYAKDDTSQQKFSELAWAGEMVTTTGDYLMWVDANLGAYKTDHAMVRSLSYQMTKQDKDSYVVAANMQYQHTGTFDWRTTRYQSYTRVYVPEGAEFMSLIIDGEDGGVFEQKDIDVGVENGHTWFGAYVRLEPGHKKNVRFIYLLPSHVVEQIDAGTYELLVQKQPGTIDHGLTLDLDFGRTMSAARPAEPEEQWGDSRYQYKTDLRVDRSFYIGL